MYLYLWFARLAIHNVPMLKVLGKELPPRVVSFRGKNVQIAYIMQLPQVMAVRRFASDGLPASAPAPSPALVKVRSTKNAVGMLARSAREGEKGCVWGVEGSFVVIPKV